MESKELLERFERKGIRPTAVRLLVAQALAASDSLLSLSDLEVLLDTVPKSTIFRTLTLFTEHRLVHCIEDGDGAFRYELCSGGHDCDISDMHTHFYCEVCRKTFCFKEVHIPQVQMPDGFEMHSVNYMVKGVCNRCKKNL
ncbi:MAG: transcriptional repressor [Bacteroidaceae bacterium]|nr:transcriptional repressor [Bacteroidaceae bacterium]